VTGRSLRVRGTGWAPASSAAVVVGDSPAVDVTVNGRGEFVVVMGQRTVVGAQGSAVGSAVVTGSNDAGDPGGWHDGRSDLFGQRLRANFGQSTTKIGADRPKLPFLVVAAAPDLYSRAHPCNSETEQFRGRLTRPSGRSTRGEDADERSTS
jgi:hypothetical protein